MNKNSIGLRRPWSRALLAGLLAGSLAFSPLAAFAIDEASDSVEPTVEAFTEPADDVSAAKVVEDAASSSPAEELPVPSEEELAAPTDDGADEASPTNEAVPVEGPSPSPAPSMEPSASGLSVDRPSAAPAAETTVTVYYCEMVYYDDPSFNDPTGFRLLGSHTYDGVTVGEKIDPRLHFLRWLGDGPHRQRRSRAEYGAAELLPRQEPLHRELLFHQRWRCLRR